MTPNPDQPYVGRNAFAHKGGMHVAGVEADARTFEHIDPAAVGNERAVLPSELSGRATIRSQAEQAGLQIDEEAAARAVERLKEREHRGYHYEAAPASFELLLRREAGRYEPLFELESFRVTTEKRADGKVETEATIKVRVDGERYVRVAEGNGPVNALDRALRGAIADRHPHLADIELTNYKVRILDESHGTGAVTRVLLDSSDGEREWGTIGVSENIIEASWEALVDSLEYAFQPRGDERWVGWPRWARSSRPDSPGQARDRRAGGGAGAGGAALRAALAGPDGRALRARLRRLAGGGDAVAVSSGTAALHLGVRALGWGPGDEVLTSPFSFVASANCLLYEGARPVFCDVDPETLNLDPAAAEAAVGERTAGILPVHIFGYPAAMPELEAIAAGRGLGILEDGCEALGAVDSEGRRVGDARQPRHLRLLRQQAADDRGGRDDRPRRPGSRRPPALRAQPGPRRRHGLARPRQARLQLPPIRPGGGARRRPAREARRDAGAARRESRRSTRRAWPGSRASKCRSRRGARSGEAGSSTSVRLPAGADRDAAIAHLGERGIAAKAYLPCIHLFPHLRELGWREGQFPVAEEASARSLALPFFPSMTESQVARVCEALAAALRRPLRQDNRP